MNWKKLNKWKIDTFVLLIFLEKLLNRTMITEYPIQNITILLTKKEKKIE
jgi:hypothetical protein